MSTLGLFAPRGHEATASTEVARFVCRVDWPVVTQPFHWMRRTRGAESTLDALGHQIADVTALEVLVRCEPRDGFAITAIEAERYVNLLAAPVTNFEPIAAPAKVTLSVMVLPSCSRSGFGPN